MRGMPQSIAYPRLWVSPDPDRLGAPAAGPDTGSSSDQYQVRDALWQAWDTGSGLGAPVKGSAHRKGLGTGKGSGRRWQAQLFAILATVSKMTASSMASSECRAGGMNSRSPCRPSH